MNALHGTWSAVCGRCTDCRRTLAFMEGPMCDRCLDALEARPWVNDEELLLEETLRDTVDVSLRPRVLEDPSPSSSDSGDLLAVNLLTHEVIFFQGAA